MNATTVSNSDSDAGRQQFRHDDADEFHVFRQPLPTSTIFNGGNLTLQETTVSANTSLTSTIANNGGSLTLQNSIVTDNYGVVIDGVITTDDGNNLLGTAVNNTTTDPTSGPGDVFSDRPRLAALGNYGGPTQTMDVLAGSPAIGAGNAGAANLPATDQRGSAAHRQRQPRHRRLPDAAAGPGFHHAGRDYRRGQPTGAITVELQDLDGNPVPAGSGGVAVTLSSSSTGGSFSYPNGLPISGGQIVIPPGASSATFDYTDTQPGTPTLTASAAGFATATQQETILPGPISDTPSTDIVVGRTLSAYFTGDVQNNQETITFTVYNQQADSITGVLLTDTLEPGVTLVSASQQPDQSGQNLAWSLGTIEGDYWTSVSITVSLANSSILQLDTGAQAFATLNAGPISNSTPRRHAHAGQRRSQPARPPRPTPTRTDPYIQQEAAVLDYNAQNIFNFLQTNIGYNSYIGSLRGARGTLWSDAGNALDVASLGVALMRASGIPAQYVAGHAVRRAQAQTLHFVDVPGQLPDGRLHPGRHDGLRPHRRSIDSGGRYTLQEETENHYWFEFNTGSGWVNADPLMAAVRRHQIGQTFTAATGRSPRWPQSLRQTTEVSLTAEIYSQGPRRFGTESVLGNGRPGSDVQRRGSGGPAVDHRQLREQF